MLKRRSEREDIAPDSFAAAYAAVGQRDEAFKWLDTAFERRVPRLAWVKTSPDFDPLHSDARFQDLLRRMKYPV
jgi:hypothetical protein